MFNNMELLLITSDGCDCAELRADVEKSAWVNTSVEAQTFLEQHLQFEHDWLSNSEVRDNLLALLCIDNCHNC